VKNLARKNRIAGRLIALCIVLVVLGIGVMDFMAAYNWQNPQQPATGPNFDASEFMYQRDFYAKYAAWLVAGSVAFLIPVVWTPSYRPVLKLVLIMAPLGMFVYAIVQAILSVQLI
jgi:hypothetical protein